MGLDVPAAEEPSEVGELLDEDRKRRERRAKLRKMKPWQRRKYERDMKRARFTIHLPKPLLEAVMETARQELVSPSSAATWLIAVGFRKWKEGVAVPRVARARTPRLEHSLVIPDRWNGERKRRTFDLPDVVDAIREVSRAYGCGRSDAAAWLMSVGVEAYDAGLSPTREPSMDVRYSFRLKLPRGPRSKKVEEKASPGDILRQYINQNEFGYGK